MIRRLMIRDLVVLEHAVLEPAEGLTVITGETGAGKSVLAESLALLAGGSADAQMVRSGAKAALVEATLALPEGFFDLHADDEVIAALREAVEDESEVTLARRVLAEGRSRCLLDGQTISRAAAAALLGKVVRRAGQHEHRRLTSPEQQRALLDDFIGEDAHALLRTLAALRHERAMLIAERERLSGDRALVEAMLREQQALREATAGMSESERESLVLERERLRDVDGLRAAAAGAYAHLRGVDDEGGALEELAHAARALEGSTDPDLQAALVLVGAAAAHGDEAVLSLAAYLDGLEADPVRLEEVEARLIAYADVERRFGGDLAEVLRRADAADGEVMDPAERLAAIDSEVRDLDAAIGVRGAELRALRDARAPGMSAAVTAALVPLAMEGARLDIQVVDDAERPEGRVQMLLQANPGLPAGPLERAASGGELSRVLLALHTAAPEAAACWVFDEIDAGIGGVTAQAVGDALFALAERQQVIVISHLAQVAARGGVHYRLDKDTDQAVTTTALALVEGEARIDEICRMLGGTINDEAIRAHAEHLLELHAPGWGAA